MSWHQQVADTVLLRPVRQSWERRGGRRNRARANVAHAALEPCFDVIQLVTYDGEHLGHVRREGPPGPRERWTAVLKGQARPVGSYGTAGAAAQALAQALGKKIWKDGCPPPAAGTTEPEDVPCGNVGSAASTRNRVLSGRPR
ncbi:MAG: hypothetical protein ACRDOU_33900 [Streptosporangiaceae bacterium]